MPALVQYNEAVAAASAMEEGPQYGSDGGDSELGYDNSSDITGKVATEEEGAGGNRPPGARARLYYAVRVGYSTARQLPRSSDNDDGLGEDDRVYDNNGDDDDGGADDGDDDPYASRPSKRRRRDDGDTTPARGGGAPPSIPSTSPAVRIRSAIFLYWQDARQFIDGCRPCRGAAGCGGPEYAAFDSLEEAEEYLIEGERRSAVGVVAELEMGVAAARSCRSKEAFDAKRKKLCDVMNNDQGSAPVAQKRPTCRGQVENRGRFAGFGGIAPFGALNPFWLGAATNAGDGGVGNMVSLSQGSISANAEPTTTGSTRSNPKASDSGQSIDDSREVIETNNQESTPNDENAAPLKSKRESKKYWDKMYGQLVSYKEANEGSIEIPEILDEEKDDPDKKRLDTLRRWINSQIQHQRRYSRGYVDSGNLTAEKIEKLREVGCQLAPSYEEMNERLAAHKAETGTLDVNKDEDEELFSWVKEQKKFLAQHFEGKPVALSDDRVQSLISLGYKQNRSRTGKAAGVVDAASEDVKWNLMLESARRYNEEHGRFPSISHSTSSTPASERTMKNWISAQRKEYRKLQQGKESSLTAQRLQRLNEIGLDVTPRPETLSWEQRMQSLREFVAEHGHCKPRKNHPLAPFVSNVRTFYRQREEGQPSCLTDERVQDLVEIGFVFRAGKTPNVTAKVRKTWDERFEELLAYKDEHGHTLVPQLSGPLGVWVKEQRTGYRRMKAGQKTNMTAEKALRLTEIGFHFDAARFKGPNREVE